jgi:hypothetical protein
MQFGPVGGAAPKATPTALVSDQAGPPLITALPAYAPPLVGGVFLRSRTGREPPSWQALRTVIRKYPIPAVRRPWAAFELTPVSGG